MPSDDRRGRDRDDHRGGGRSGRNSGGGRDSTRGNANRSRKDRSRSRDGPAEKKRRSLSRSPRRQISRSERDAPARRQGGSGHTSGSKQADADGADGSKSGPGLVVSGCANQTISNIVKGTYSPHSSNHGRRVYRKNERDPALNHEVLIYFWDDRDGSDLAGWWFGPQVGGDQVWAFHPSRSSEMPPTGEWNVPHDGPIDPTFSVTEAEDREERRRRRDDPRQASDKQADEGKRDKEASTRDARTRDKERDRKRTASDALDKSGAAGSDPHEVGKSGTSQTSTGKRNREAKRQGEEEDRREERKRDEKKPEADRRRNDEDAKKREEDRRRRDEETRRKKDEESRKMQDEIQKKREEWKREEAESKKRKEEQRREDAEKQRREEEERRRKGEEEEQKHREEAKRKKEDEAKRKAMERLRAEEEKKKHEEEEQRKKEEAREKLEQEARFLMESQAVLTVLNVLTKFAGAMPEDYDDLKLKFERTVARDMPRTGSRETVLRKQADKVLQSASAYVCMIKEQRRRSDEWNSRKQPNVPDQEQISKNLLAELTGCIGLAEAAAERAQKCTVPVKGLTNFEDSAAPSLIDACEEAGNAAMEACKRCTDFVSANRAQMEEPLSMREEVAKTLAGSHLRIQEAARKTLAALDASKATREKIPMQADKPSV
mmetsp:Transcript_65479/g.124934  ORF Transcript_65479/g.124934 Transcript_65479/m.124934 type:complete len:662 (-) Transcript_65479:72-2057(-)